MKSTIQPRYPKRNCHSVWQKSKRLLLLIATLAGGSNLHAELWSNPATWGGAVPVAGQNVVIPSGKTVELDVDTASLGTLEIQGTLRFLPQNLNLTAKHIVVHHGLLEIGTEASPFLHKATVTLTGTDRNENYMIHAEATGTKGLIAIHGGRIEMHGARRSALAWTKLSATANVGATSISLVTAPNWRVGDKIIIAPSGFNPNEGEVRTISSISGTTVTFTPALAYKHWGTIQTIDGKTTDQRAEVGILTRDIVVQGAADSDADFFGGHTMIHHEGWARFEGVEFYRMGQLRKQGRYSVHWHFAGDGTGQYIKNCSIRDSFHRGIATHQTDNVLVENNVAYNVKSHMYIPAEDGVEIGNVYRGNLGVLSIKIDTADFAFPSSVLGRSLQSEERAGLFWFQHPNNKIEGNAVAGQTFGHGYFYDIGRTRYVDGASADFNNNTAHSISGPTEADYNYGPNQRGSGLFVDDYKPMPVATPQIFNGLNAYKCTTSAAWTEQDEQILSNATLADSGTGLITHRGVIEDSVVFGDTANTIGGASALIGPEDKKGGVHIVRQQGGDKTPNIRNVTFIDVKDGALMTLEPFWNHGASVEGITAIRTVPVYFKNSYWNNSAHTDPTAFLMDKDGTGSGQAGPQRLVQKNHPLITGTSILSSSLNGYRNPMVASTEVIVDNPSAVLTGSWTVSTMPSGFHGSNYLHDGNTGKGSKVARFTPNLAGGGWYVVSGRWVAASGHASNVPFSIAGGKGESTPVLYGVDQRVNGSAWVPLDSFYFNSGTGSNVAISNTGTSGNVIADAVKYTLLIPQ